MTTLSEPRHSRLCKQLVTLAFIMVVGAAATAFGEREDGVYPTIAAPGSPPPEYQRDIAGLDVREAGVFPTTGESANLSEEYRTGPDTNYRDRAINSGPIFTEPFGYTGFINPDPYGYQGPFSDRRFLFNGYDDVVSFFTREGIRFYDGYYREHQRLYADAGVGLIPFSTAYNPFMADYKVGPLFIDLKSISGTLLYTDFAGTDDGRTDLQNDDGFLSIISTHIGFALQLSSRFYFVLNAHPFYIPSTNEFGLEWGGINGGNSFARIGYDANVGNWMVGVYDQFSAHHPYSFVFADLHSPAYDSVGRYNVGFLDFPLQRSNEFDTDEIYFKNAIGAHASGPLGGYFRGGFSATHNDSWRGTDFEDHREWDVLRGRVDYLGYDWIVPHLSYTLSAHDRWSTLHHRIWLGANAWITDTVTADAAIGYLFTSGGGTPDYDRPLARASITHFFDSYTYHRLRAGIQYYDSEIGTEYLGEDITYTIARQLGFRTTIGASAYFGNYEQLDGTLGEFTEFGGRIYGQTHLTELTRLSLLALYRDRDYSDLDNDYNNWIYRARLAHSFTPFLEGSLTYQYEDARSNRGYNFNEHLYRLTLTYFF